ncbi:uroporphyrinogen decarboxylase family protein [Metallumcola ferriviriculae]|uniref:Uroporphyrinogen decarboxylase family protein n=1 Tax=Metallumcola ferriviriculae TaxID=3039180 RepID=A0AAU0US11_9FIRM|nr:uroporphyrinogen decarboxylase family protein [Desulfitibacteraceae bacterium MK1]
MLTPKETVLKAFNMELAERVPVVIYGGGVWTMKNSGNRFDNYVGEPEKYAQLIIDTAEKVQSDMVFPGSGFNNLHAAALGGTVKYREVGAPDLEAPLINEPADLDKLDISRLKDDEVINTIWKATEIVNEKIGDKYLVGPTAWGPFTIAGQLYGVERLMRGTFKQKEFMHAILEFSTELCYEFYRPMFEAGYITCAALADPTASGDLISRKQFETFAMPYLKDFSRRLHDNFNGLHFLHICGDTSDRLGLIPETEVDLFAFDYKVDMAKAKEEIGDRQCIAGNVDPVHALTQGTQQRVREASTECIKKANEGGGYVLLPGCDIPPTVPLENIQAFVQTAHDWKN